MKKVPTIGLVEVPEVQVRGANDGIGYRERLPLISKQILISNLRAGGFDARLVNLLEGDDEEEYGEVEWGGQTLKKVLVGRKITSVDPDACDAWGVTMNFTRQREAACLTVKYLASTGKPVVVGGSDAIAAPDAYFKAGAAAVVKDKSGGANWPIFDHVLEKPEREELSGVLFPDGTEYRKRFPGLHPEDWPLPSLDVVKECFGIGLSYNTVRLDPQGSVFADIGCDRKCDFCQTPSYRLGYLRMSPQRTLKWFELQKEAGSRGVQSQSDQFLGRILFEGGRQEILDILNGLREREIPFAWVNGVELKKATLGRGIRPDGDMTPDDELVRAIWGWDGKVGCYHAFIPAERPVEGKEAYYKLMPWREHCNMMRAIVRAGVPLIGYGVIIGFPDDSHESLRRLEEALSTLYQELKAINPKLIFRVRPYSVSPIVGTPAGQQIRESGLLAFDDPTIIGGFWTPCINTKHLSYLELSDWQNRLLKIGDSVRGFNLTRKNSDNKD
ncbi:MAG: radical SAM protein [Okeania sp. SIO3H1]|nr:radical SAM protein [Okeania sp. SIO3H1]